MAQAPPQIGSLLAGPPQDSTVAYDINGTIVYGPADAPPELLRQLYQTQLTQEQDSPKLLEAPGEWESNLSIPGGLMGWFPALKPLSIPAAGIGGAVGAGIDSAKDPKRGFSIEQMLQGLIRQGGMEATFSGLAGKGAEHTLMAGKGMNLAAAKGALTRSARHPLGPGLSMDATFDSIKRTGKNVTDRIDSFSDLKVPRVSLASGAGKLIKKEAAKAPGAEFAAGKALVKDLKEMVKGGPKALDAPALQAQKQGGHTGFEAFTKAESENRAVGGSARLRKLWGDNAQRILEKHDLANRTVKDRLTTPTLKDMNKNLGNFKELQQFLDPNKAGGTNVLKRMFMGGAVGSVPQFAWDQLNGTGSTDGGVALNRYGIPGAVAGLTYGAFPFGTPALMKLIAELTPTSVRMFGPKKDNDK